MATRCPRCAIDLHEGVGAAHEDVCGRCAGRFLPREVVQRIVVEEQGIAQETLVELVALFGGATAPCPACAAPMKPVRLRGVPLDACARCGGAWCDRGELARLSQGRHEEVAASPADAGAPAREVPSGARGLLARLVDTAAAGASAVLSRVDAAMDRVDAAFPPPDAAALDGESAAYTPLGAARPGASWSVVQESLADLDVERVRAALSRTSRWTPAEAMQMVRSADGILADALTHDEASMLAAALAAQGLTVHVVASERLALPPPRSANRLDVDDAALRPWDHHGARYEVPWHDVIVVGAASLRRSVRKAGKAATLIDDSGANAHEYAYAVVASDEIVLDVVLARPDRRLRATSSTFVFGAPAADRAAAFSAVCREVAARAVQAARSGGAVDVLEGRRPRRAKSARVHERELSWLWFSLATVRGSSSTT